MNNHWPELWFSLYLDNELSVDERTHADAHLAGCTACQQELTSFRGIQERLSASRTYTLPPALAAQLERRLGTATVFKRLATWLGTFHVSHPRLAWTTAAGAFVFGVFLIYQRTPDTLPLEPLLAAHARYSAGTMGSSSHITASNFIRQLDSYEGEED